MKSKLLSIAILISFLAFGIVSTGYAQETKEHKNTKIEGKTDHSTIQTKVTKKDHTMVKDSTKIKKHDVTKAKVADKEVGKTDDGKIIYQGKKCGKYYLNDKGKKVYISEKGEKSTKNTSKTTTTKEETKETK
ncbi:MAG: hypothetical protein Q8858_15725 [Bacteroidota bacterium]|nr:hypothetical protein [Bacteroidota bacterium]